MFFFPSGTNFLCTAPWESQKNYQHGLDAGPLEFQFLRPMGCLTNPFGTLSLCFGVTGKTPGLISCNNFVYKSFICIGHHVNVFARCNSIFPWFRCQEVWYKTCTQLSLSQILFLNPNNYSLGDIQRFCYHSWCDLTLIFDQTKSAIAAMFTSVRVDFGRPPLSSSSTSSLPSRNGEYHLKTFDQFTASFP